MNKVGMTDEVVKVVLYEVEYIDYSDSIAKSIAYYQKRPNTESKFKRIITPLISALDEADKVDGLVRDCESAIPLPNVTPQTRLYQLLNHLRTHADKLRGLE